MKVCFECRSEIVEKEGLRKFLHVCVFVAFVCTPQHFLSSCVYVCLLPWYVHLLQEDLGIL